MALLLLQLAAHPDEIAATRCGDSLPGGAFFLDFSRPLRRQRYCGVWNRWVGATMALQVPLVHEGQAQGRHWTTVDRLDPYFRELQRLWRERHPRACPVPTQLAQPQRIEKDFAAQFADDARRAAA